MREEKIYTVTWTQTLDGRIIEDKFEDTEVTDLTQAQELLARIMAK